MLEEAGFVDVRLGRPVDTFGGAPGEDKARAYDVRGYPFLARKPSGLAEGAPAYHHDNVAYTTGARPGGAGP